MTTDTLSQHAIQDSMHHTQAKHLDQYTLWQILGIWAIAALPMALLAWVVAPAIIPYSPLQPGITYWLLMIAGMAWQFVVSLVIILPRTRHAALERHPPAYLAANPA